MNISYTHIIVSRVNVKTSEQSKNDIWLKNRIEILNKTLRPSIMGQTSKNFKFITLWGYEPVDCIEGEIPLVINAGWTTQILREMKSGLLKLIDDEYVLMTRIDSDNCLGDMFVETLQNNITEEIPFYYDVKKIDVFNLMNGLRTTWHPTLTSGFISVMEKKTDFEYIPYKYVHSDIENHINGISLDLDVLLTVHGSNLCMVKSLGDRNKFDLSKYNLK